MHDPGGDRYRAYEMIIVEVASTGGLWRQALIVHTAMELGVVRPDGDGNGFSNMVP